MVKILSIFVAFSEDVNFNNIVIRNEKPLKFAQKIFERLLYFSQQYVIFKTNGRDNSNFNNFFVEVRTNPYTFLNLRRLYYVQQQPHIMMRE